jgi:beta-lactam-binding protein with PASTA domain
MKKIVLRVIAFFILLWIFIYCGYTFLGLFIVKKEVTVPSIVGEEMKMAKRTLRNSRLRFTVEYSKRNDYPNNFVFYQYPKGGNKVLIGFTIKLYIAENSNKSVVPDLLGLDKANAKIILKKIRLNLGKVIYRKSKVNLKDQIIYQKPEPGENVDYSSNVDIIINDGMLQRNLIVPYFLRNDYQYVKRLCNELGLIEATPKDEIGEIVYQNLMPGNIVKYRSKINFEVASETVKTADKSIIKNDINRISPKSDHQFFNIDYTLPNFFSKKKLRVILKSSKGKQILVNKKVKGGYRLSKLIKYSEKTNIIIYLDGKQIKKWELE